MAIIFGHRGIPTLAPENSLKSFQMILNNKIQGVEFDIHLTKDQKLIVIHDYNTKKMTGFNHEISDTDYITLKKLTISKDQYIPLLEEVFELLKDSVTYDLEIKSRGGNRKTIVTELLKLIEKFNLKQNVMVSSFDPLLLKAFNSLKSGIPVGIIYCNDNKTPLIARFGFGLFLTKCQIIKPEKNQLKGFLFFFYTKVLRKTPYTWTVNTKEDMNYAISRGCKGICSDIPQKIS